MVPKNIIFFTLSVLFLQSIQPNYLKKFPHIFLLQDPMIEYVKIPFKFLLFFALEMAILSIF